MLTTESHSSYRVPDKHRPRLDTSVERVNPGERIGQYALQLRSVPRIDRVLESLLHRTDFNFGGAFRHCCLTREGSGEREREDDGMHVRHAGQCSADALAYPTPRIIGRVSGAPMRIMLRKSLFQNCVGEISCASARVDGVDFQPCSFRNGSGSEDRYVF